LISDAQLGLEQDTAPEGDLVRAVEVGVRAGMDGDANAGPDKDAITELRRKTDRRIVRFAGCVCGGEGVGPKRRRADPIPTIT